MAGDVAHTTHCHRESILNLLHMHRTRFLQPGLLLLVEMVHETNWQFNRLCCEASLWIRNAVPRVWEVVPRQLQAICRHKTREEWHQSHFNGSRIIAAVLLHPVELRGGWLAPPPSLGPRPTSSHVTLADACGPTQHESFEPAASRCSLASV